jgi:hypothetical protein
MAAHPTPNEGETESEFMARCMSDEEMMAEFPEQGARAEACQRSAGGGGMSAPSEGE